LTNTVLALNQRLPLLLAQEFKKQLEAVIIVHAGEHRLQFQVSLCRENDCFSGGFISLANGQTALVYQQISLLSSQESTSLFPCEIPQHKRSDDA
jgi:hypothetical protein